MYASSGPVKRSERRLDDDHLDAWLPLAPLPPQILGSGQIVGHMHGDDVRIVARDRPRKGQCLASGHAEFGDRHDRADDDLLGHDWRLGRGVPLPDAV